MLLDKATANQLQSK